MIDPTLRALFAAAYLAALQPVELPVTTSAPRVRLDDIGRPVNVPLRPNGGDRG